MFEKCLNNFIFVSSGFIFPSNLSVSRLPTHTLPTLPWHRDFQPAVPHGAIGSLCRRCLPPSQATYNSQSKTDFTFSQDLEFFRIFKIFFFREWSLCVSLSRPQVPLRSVIGALSKLHVFDEDLMQVGAPCGIRCCVCDPFDVCDRFCIFLCPLHHLMFWFFWCFACSFHHSTTEVEFLKHPLTTAMEDQNRIARSTTIVNS